MQCYRYLLALLLLLISGFSSIAFAEKITTEKSPRFYRGVSVEVDGGYAKMNWKHSNPTVRWTNNEDGGFALGGNTGYQYSRYFGMEIGAYHLPEAKYTIPTIINFKVQSWFAYLGFKILAPVGQSFNFFAKIAVAYRSIQFSSSPIRFAPNGNHSLWRPVVAVGAQCYFTPSWFLTLQYMFIPGNDNIKSATDRAFFTPEVHLMTLGLAYKFEV